MLLVFDNNQHNQSLLNVFYRKRLIFLFQWYKFDHEDVTKCKKEEAITGNYRGTIDSEFVFKRQTVTNSTSAYALVYIKKSSINSSVSQHTTIINDYSSSYINSGSSFSTAI